MPALSRAQQAFMGMVHATQKGELPEPSKEVAEAAKTMSPQDAKDFASTKHKGLPARVKQSNCTEHDKNIPASFDARQKPFIGKAKDKSKKEKLAFDLGFIKAARNAGLTHAQAIAALGKLDR